MPPWLPDHSASVWMRRSSRAFSWRWPEPGRAPRRHTRVQALPRRGKPRLQAVSWVSPSSCWEGKDTHTHQWGAQSRSTHHDQTCTLEVGYGEFSNQLFNSCLKLHSWPRQTGRVVLDLPTARDNREACQMALAATCCWQHYTMLSTSLCKM